MFGWFRAAFVRRQTLKRAASARLAPSRQMRGVQTLAAKQTPDLGPGAYIGPPPRQSRSRYSAVNWRRVGLATTSGSGGRSLLFVFGPGGLVATLLGPQGRRRPPASRSPGLSLFSSVLTSTPYTNSTGRRCLGHVGREGLASDSIGTTERDCYGDSGELLHWMLQALLTMLGGPVTGRVGAPAS